ncbi:acetyl-CoA synthetase [Halogranum amylolyticum]|uniref:acetate--CoA ligase n=1 Tax=Halogranum amylolyticum TaxID=660520 RepID=A0A1H8US43_9EURY|nr:acetate--CoA ligase [Halogranum amylolyticum]SEP05817.1 acetyl-CoA synthetase [Halogranum amylolyticum]
MSDGRNEIATGQSRMDDRIAPPPSFVEQANVTDPTVYETFDAEWPDCWRRAADLLTWTQSPESVLDDGGDSDGVRWFPGGRLNASENCLDRHVDAGRGDQTAIQWEGKLGETRTKTYRELHRDVNAFAAGLRDLEVEADDVVTLFMPVIPELVVAMLACARIGAPHSVVFAGFSADALATRMERAESDVVVTCDGYYRRGNAVDLLSKVDNACLSVSYETTQVVVDRLGDERYLGDHRRYCDLLAAHDGETVDPVERAADDLLFYIYTSGTTGEPTQVRHTTGGYLSHVAWTSHAVLDLEPRDTHWCTADIGWITGHSYVVYGPLALGATTVLYEGTPDQPEKDRFWKIIERNAVDVFYTAPTAIRAFMKWGADHLADYDLSSLRLLGTVGEPIDETAWKWYYKHIGNEECPIVDTWWQTETGGMMLSTLPAVDAMRPGVVGRPLPGVELAVVNGLGEELPDGETGQLVVTKPWPGQPKSLCEGTEWAQSIHLTESIDRWRYATGDSAMRHDDGYVSLLGRLDDVLNVSGKRLGTTEIESAIVAIDGIAEAAVVGGDDELRGSTVHAYVSPEANVAAADDLRTRVREGVEDAIGPVAVPTEITFTSALPKTRSGKILRRYLEAIANGEDPGDTSALRNPEVVGELESLVDD